MPLNNPIQSTAIINPLSIAVEVDELLEQDFLRLHDKIDSIETSLEGLNVSVDLSPITTKLDVIEDKIDLIILKGHGYSTSILKKRTVLKSLLWDNPKSY